MKGGSAKFFLVVQNEYKMLILVWSQLAVAGVPACPQHPHQVFLKSCSKIASTKFFWWYKTLQDKYIQNNEIIVLLIDENQILRLLN